MQIRSCPQCGTCKNYSGFFSRFQITTSQLARAIGAWRRIHIGAVSITNEHSREKPCITYHCWGRTNDGSSSSQVIEFHTTLVPLPGRRWEGIRVLRAGLRHLVSTEFIPSGGFWSAESNALRQSGPECSKASKRIYRKTPPRARRRS